MQIKFLRPSHSIDFFPSFLSCLLVFRKYFREIEHFYILFRLSLTLGIALVTFRFNAVPFFSRCVNTHEIIWAWNIKITNKNLDDGSWHHTKNSFSFSSSRVCFSRKKMKNHFLNLSQISFFSIQRSSWS